MATAPIDNQPTRVWLYLGLIALTLAGLLLSLAIGRGGDGPTFGWRPVLEAIPDGGSLLLFTALQLPGMSDDDFAAQCHGLEAEFEIIRLAGE